MKQFILFFFSTLCFFTLVSEPNVIIHNHINTTHKTNQETNQQQNPQKVTFCETSDHVKQWTFLHKKQIGLCLFSACYLYALYTFHNAYQEISSIHSISMWNHTIPTTALMQMDHAKITQELLYMIQEKYRLQDPTKKPIELFLLNLKQEQSAAQKIIMWYERLATIKSSWIIFAQRKQYEHAKDTILRLQFFYNRICRYELNQ